jgi:hypothetical protein
MGNDEVPRIGNRSDTLELPEQLINTAQSKREIIEFIRRSLEVFRDTMEREMM